ncbi:hypothetical protein LZ554_005322 [Drepanopeziza brunnea f. sp. 'monogermtubi']|nr:hypothetical protein LZ554_005322 [Drepanopeziza brunnea f. sp. 'monogermtubi']
MSSYYGGRGGGGQRWDSERFAQERDRVRFEGRGGGGGYSDKDRFEERESGFLRGPGRGGPPREHSVDEIYERRGPRVFEEDRYESRQYHDDGPRYLPERERPFGRNRGASVTLEKERERDFLEREPDPLPLPRRGGSRPAFLRRQSSLDTFDRKPLTRFVDREQREEYGPPARYREDFRAPPLPPLMPIPLPRTRGLPPPPRRYHEREYDDIEIAEPDHYGDDSFRGYPERVREREIIRRRRRSRSRDSHGTSRASHSVKDSVRSSSTSSSSSEETTISVRSEFPKKGKTRMPARLVQKRAIIDLGYPFEEEGDVIIIQKALGRENIDEVIKLSEDYRVADEKAQMSGARSEAGTIIEERHEVFTVPPPPASVAPSVPPPAPPAPAESVAPPSHHSHSHHGGSQYGGEPVIINSGPGPREEVYERREVYESNGPLTLAVRPHDHRKDERAIRAEIKALEAEKEALRAQKRADRELRKADRLRSHGRSSESDLVLYERDRFERNGEEVTMVRTERIEEPEGGALSSLDRRRD